MRCATMTMLTCLYVCGCSNNAYLDTSLELMNAERRGLEERLFELELLYEEKVERLHRCERENEELRGNGFGEGDSGRSSDAGSRSRTSPTTPDSPDLDDSELTIPDITLPDPEDSSQSEPSEVQAAPVPLVSARANEGEVTHVRIHPRSLTGVDFDQEPGDDGLSMNVEPLDVDGKLVRLPGRIRIAVLDYASRSRVAHWDLQESDVIRFLQDSPPERGIRLHLLWPQDPPQHQRLRVHVRYYISDERYVEDRRDVRIDLAPKLSERWTPRAGARSPIVVDAIPTPSQTSDDGESMTTRPQWRPYR